MGDLLDDIKKIKKILLPGPIDIEDEVLRAAAIKPISHRIPEFSSLYLEITRMYDELVGLRRGDGETILAPGSATLGLDMVYANLLTEKSRVLVVKYGFFAKRLEWMVRRYSRSVDVLETAPGTLPSLDEILGRVENREYSVVTMVHNETSTGVTARYIDELARICRKNNAIFILDAVSSIGAEELKASDWGIDVVVAAPQKAIGAPPGLAIITLNKRAIEAVEAARRHRSVPYYYDIPMYIRYKREHGWIPTTPPTNNMYALYVALKKIHRYGIDKFIEMHKKRSEKIYRYAEKKGLKIFPENNEYRSRSVLVIEKNNAISIVDYVKKKYGILIATGVAEMADKLIRIGMMGFMDEGGIKKAIDIVSAL